MSSIALTCAMRTICRFKSVGRWRLSVPEPTKIPPPQGNLTGAALNRLLAVNSSPWGRLGCYLFTISSRCFGIPIHLLKVLSVSLPLFRAAGECPQQRPLLLLPACAKAGGRLLPAGQKGRQELPARTKQLC